MVVGDAYVFPGFLMPVLIQLSFPKPPTTFLSKATNYFPHMLLQRWEVKIVWKKVRLKQGLNSQPLGHESDMLITEPHEWGTASG